MKKITPFKVFVVSAACSLSLSAFANQEVESCKAQIFHAADTIQSIANTVPNRAFGKFTKNGRMIPLALAVTGLGGGDVEEGAKKLFQTAEPIFEQHRLNILTAAQSCVGKCNLVSALQKRCDEVQDLAELLRNLNFGRATRIAKAINSFGGTDGVKRAVQKEVDQYYRDRN